MIPVDIVKPWRLIVGIPALLYGGLISQPLFCKFAWCITSVLPLE